MWFSFLPQNNVNRGLTKSLSPKLASGNRFSQTSWPLSWELGSLRIAGGWVEVFQFAPQLACLWRMVYRHNIWPFQKHTRPHVVCNAMCGLQISLSLSLYMCARVCLYVYVFVCVRVCAVLLFLFSPFCFFCNSFCSFLKCVYQFFFQPSPLLCALPRCEQPPARAISGWVA